jgi:hypothetical protein
MTSRDSNVDEIDMSAAAIELRLRRVSQLRDLCLSLGKATIIRDAEEVKPRDTEKNDQRDDR